MRLTVFSAVRPAALLGHLPLHQLAPVHLQGAAKITLTGAVSFLRELGHTASNLYHKRTDDEEEDVEYLKVGGQGLQASP